MTACHFNDKMTEMKVGTECLPKARAETKEKIYRKKTSQPTKTANLDLNHTQTPKPMLLRVVESEDIFFFDAT